MHSPRENYTSSVKNVSKNSSSVKVINDEKNVSKKANETAEFRLLAFFLLQAGKWFVKRFSYYYNKNDMKI